MGRCWRFIQENGLFACYNTPYLTESDLKKAYSLLTEHIFFTRKINLSKLWFLMKIVCIGIMYFSEMIIIKDGKDIPNGPFLQWSAINFTPVVFYLK